MNKYIEQIKNAIDCQNFIITDKLIIKGMNENSNVYLNLLDNNKVIKTYHANGFLEQFFAFNNEQDLLEFVHYTTTKVEVAFVLEKDQNVQIIKYDFELENVKKNIALIKQKLLDEKFNILGIEYYSMIGHINELKDAYLTKEMMTAFMQRKLDYFLSTYNNYLLCISDNCNRSDDLNSQITTENRFNWDKSIDLQKGEKQVTLRFLAQYACLGNFFSNLQLVLIADNNSNYNDLELTLEEGNEKNICDCIDIFLGLKELEMN